MPVDLSRPGLPARLASSCSPLKSRIHVRLVVNQVAQFVVERGDLAAGTIDTFLLWRLTGDHVTDAIKTELDGLYSMAAAKFRLEMRQKYGGQS